MSRQRIGRRDAIGRMIELSVKKNYNQFMSASNSMNVSVIGAGSTYGVYLVKWALTLKYFPETNNELPVPSIGTISYSNTSERNRNLVLEVLENDLSQMPSFSSKKFDDIAKDVHGYINWREMIQKEKPGMVVICSPLETHAPYLRELLNDFKVKNILCEPPITHLNEADSVDSLVHLAEEKGVTVGVNQQYAILYQKLQGLPMNPQESDSGKFGDLLTGLTGLHITFVTHGSRVWRKMQGVGEREILEDLGPHVYELIPKSLRDQKVTVRDVKKEGDDVFLNYVEYDILFGTVPVKLTLGYHRKLKSLKLVFKKGKKDFEFNISGASNPQTGEFTRWIEGKNYAYYFKHLLNTDLVKTSFIHSLAGKPEVTLQEGINSLKFIRSLYTR